MDDEYRSTTKKHKSTEQPGVVTKLVAGIIVVVIVAISAFAGGIQYQKGKGMRANVATVAGRFGQARQGGFGTVTAVSATSITVSDPRRSSTKTYAIDSSTTITDNGSPVSYTDITVGATVVVRASSSTSTTATTIEVNPSFGGGPGGASSSTPPSATGTDQSPDAGTNGNSTI